MAKNDGGKKVQTYYLKEINIDFLNQRAFNESTPNNRITDDAILDAYLDQLRESKTSPTPNKQKKSARELATLPA